MSNSKQMTLNDGDDVFIAAKFSHWGVGSQNERVAYLHVGSETVLFPEKHLAAPPIAAFRALTEKWRSGIHAERLRKRWNQQDGRDFEAAGLALDELLNCADELTLLIAEAEERGVMVSFDSA